ncbi:MAG: type I-C CRISPR-associated protein Cas5c [Bacteroidales bacterium]|nr:type I-C CRISPR-associated protein Cas5c [Bacteroidales bacterium]
MIDNEILRVKVTGEFACFTRPDLKVERMTYPCMTPSAARGVLDSILWKPEFQWWIHRIVVLNPVKFFSVRRNEINAKQGKTPILIEERRAQRNSIILKDVAYIIEASVFQKNFNPVNHLKKYTEMFRRRVKKGQCWRRPFLGTREFAAEFCAPDGTEQPIRETIPIGSMLFDIFFDEKGNPSPLFFYDVAVVDGILMCPKSENEKMMLSSHFQPEMDSKVSSVIYGFNQKEEMEVL